MRTRRPREPVELELPGLDPADAAERARAAAVLERRRARARARALATEMALAQEERRTLERIRQQQALARRIAEDRRLEALLAARRAGKPVAQAIAEADRRRASG